MFFCHKLAFILCSSYEILVFNATGEVTEPILTENTSHVFSFFQPGVPYRILVYSVSNSTRSTNPIQLDFSIRGAVI